MQTNREMTAQEAFRRLAALCARGEHCQHDMLQKMRQWGVGDEDQAEVMARLTDGRYVDDERYARALVRDKVRYDRWGRRKLEQALWAKRIDDGISQRVLDEVSPDEWADALRPLLSQKRRQTKAASEYEMTVKLMKYAMSRGFTMDVIRQCMDTGDADELAE